MRRITIILAVIVCFGTDAFAQPTGFAKEVVDLINMARTDPAAFLLKYREPIGDCSPQFAKILERSSAVPKVIWDNGLVSMQKSTVETGNLNPKYPGKMEGFRLSSGGSGTGSGGMDAIDMLCSFYTIINDPAETHFGIYYKDGDYSFSWGASLTISSNKAFTYDKVPNTTSVDFTKLNTAKNE
jgi:hypothetical protein